MSQEKGLAPGFDMADKQWRKYNRVEYVLRSILQPGGLQHGGGREARIPLRRTLFAATALVAFTLGLSVGITIPVYFLPSYSVHAKNLTSSRTNNSRYVETSIVKPVTPFNRVSFVDERKEVLRKRSGNVEGVFWGKEVEAQLPKGYGQPELERWQRFVNSSPVVKLEEGCGRMQNRLATFDDGSKACVRYRQNTDQIQGELYSFYLGRALGLSNLAPSTLAAIRSSEPLWEQVRAQVSLAQWEEERPVVLTQYIGELEAATIPRVLRNSSRRLHPPDVRGDSQQLLELAQWSDLIIFDYLTANLDRIVNNLYNLQWNSGMMEAPAHNLARQASSRLLLFLDNESGLLHGYRLLDKYESYHALLLDALCVFRRSTIEAVEKLRRERKVGKLLNSMLPHREMLPGLPEKSVKILYERLDRVHDQVAWCSKQYSDLSTQHS